MNCVKYSKYGGVLVNATLQNTFRCIYTSLQQPALSSQRVVLNQLRQPKVQSTKKTNPAATAKSKDLLIECKRPEYNMFHRHVHRSGPATLLASHAWHNRKSNGDFFTIHRVKEEKVAVETSTFEEMGLCPELIGILTSQGISVPTEIQWRGMQPILEGRNVLLAAETGCGKTLAYLLPLVQQLHSWLPLACRPPETNNAPLGLVISPSRELAIQIMDVATPLVDELGVSAVCLTGGRTKSLIMKPSAQQIDLLITSFGVIRKLLGAGIYDLSHVRHVVLDEADTLLDDSFNTGLQSLLSKIGVMYQSERAPGQVPEGAQLTLASATMPRYIGPILKDIVEESSVVHVTTEGLHRVLPRIEQRFQRIGRQHRPEELLRIAKAAHSGRTPLLIFSNKTPTCDWISLFLNSCGVTCMNLNADMPYAIRQGVFQKFQDGEINILSVTDIGSRGLDTTRVELVVNFDFPVYLADYIHRCGRTGRVGSLRSGKVINLITGPAETRLVNAIERAARDDEPLPNVNANIASIIENKETHKANRQMKGMLKSKAS